MQRPFAPEIMSVCRHLPHPGDPGAGVFVLQRLQAMSRLAAVRIVQPIPYAPVLRPMPSWARAPSHVSNGIQIEHAPMPYIPRIMKSLDGYWIARSIRAIAAERRRATPHLILDGHFGYPDGVGCVRVAQELGVPVFVTLRGVETSAALKGSVARQMIRALNAATGCMSVSYSLLEQLARHGLRNDHSVVIANAVNRSLFYPGDRVAARSALQIPADAKVIVSIGNLISRKRHHVVVRALAELRKSEPNALLIILGGADHEPGYPAALRRMVGELGLSEAVRLPGALPSAEVGRHLRAADVFALGTAKEGCCNAVLEALASGCPVVTTPVGDNDRYVMPGRNGLLVPVDDAAAMSQALRTALSGSWDRHGISALLDVGDWDGVARRVLDFMGQRLEGAGRRAA